jgi:hypothetical protein
MDELEEYWAQMLVDASERAALSGRDDVAEYLRLKATNDAVRATGVRWLLDAFVGMAFEQEHPGIKIEREEGHAFSHGASTMAGTCLKIHCGVRCLEIEAGWARVPSHGIMREAALARANILHFGRGRDNESLKLVHNSDFPEWILPSGDIFLLENARHHVERLLQD